MRNELAHDKNAVCDRMVESHHLFICKMNSRLLLPLLCLLVVASACDNPNAVKKKNEDSPASDSTEVVSQQKKPSTLSQIKAITRSETLIQQLSGKKSLLTKSLIDDSVVQSQYAQKEIDYFGLDVSGLDAAMDNSAEKVSGAADLVEKIDVPVKSKSSKAKGDNLWRELPFAFEDAQFGVLRGSFLKDSLFETELKFEGRMRSEDGKLLGAKSKLKVVWENIGSGWKVKQWKPLNFSVVSPSATFFQNVTDTAFKDKETRERLSIASHEDLIVKRTRKVDEVEETLPNGKTVKSYAVPEARPEYKGCNDWGSVGQYPSVSTVDYNGDGFDDIFVTDRWQAPQLLKNNGDFTFTDVTSEAGIDISEMATCGYFFDFDNDGDSDLLVGMSMVPSLFFVNEGGKFSRHEAICNTLEKTRFVNAISIADINRDGLLDLYLSTYMTGTGPIEDWIGFATHEAEQLKTKVKILKADKFVDRAGPPNIMLLNRGDNFEWAKIDDTLKQYRSSYQSSWMDVDGDGDHDLYVCNDFAPDVLLRNDTPRGSFDVSFVDITPVVIPTMDMGFGMGCDWADYDNDGDLDLYVSNMYSKAGNRIVDQMDGTSERLKVAAHGNFLFENEGGQFSQVAGDGEGMQHVARVGWSYGGQFADFDNDGHMDLYVPSGCYSAPDKIKTKVDL